MVKNLPTMQETWVQSLGWEDLLEKGMATHSTIPGWRIPWTEEALQATVHVVAKSWTQLSDQHNLIELSQCSEGNSPPKLDYEWKDTIKQDRKMKMLYPCRAVITCSRISWHASWKCRLLNPSPHYWNRLFKIRTRGLHSNNDPSQWFWIGVILAPKGHLLMPGAILGCHNREGRYHWHLLGRGQGWC